VEQKNKNAHKISFFSTFSDIEMLKTLALVKDVPFHIQSLQ